MSHKFDPKNMQKLDNPERRKALPPRETLLKLGLQPGDVMADIGCGIGYFSLPAAEIVGPKGQVYALDVSEVMLEEVKKAVESASLTNLQTILTDGADYKLEDATATFGFVSLVLHEVEDSGQFLGEIRRILAPGGKIAIVEWQKVPTPGGPPLEERLAQDEVRLLLETAGFRSITTVEISEQFYGMTAQK